MTSITGHDASTLIGSDTVSGQQSQYSEVRHLYMTISEPDWIGGGVHRHSPMLLFTDLEPGKYCWPLPYLSLLNPEWGGSDLKQTNRMAIILACVSILQYSDGVLTFNPSLQSIASCLFVLLPFLAAGCRSLCILLVI